MTSPALDTVGFQATVPVVADCDVLVVGGGPSGIAASVAAARNGARTMLVEQHSYLGGNNTHAGIGPYMPAYSNDGRTQIVGGVFDELVRRMAQEGGAIHPSEITGPNEYTGYWSKILYAPTPESADPVAWPSYCHDHITPFDTEVLKSEAEALCLDAGVELLYDSLLVDALLDGSACTGGVFANKAGHQAIRAAITVDCTGDGDVAHRAGAPIVFGREGDGKTMPGTLFMRVTNVDRAEMETYAREHPDEILPFEGLIERARTAGDYDIVKDMVDIYMEPNGLFWRVNMTKLSGVDGTDPSSITRAAIEGRLQARRLMRFFHSYVPGLQNAVLVDTAPGVYIRESRRILGEYVLTEEDLDAGVVFEDAVACGSWPIDISKGSDIGGSFVDRRSVRPTANYYTIPYRSLVPRGVDGLVVSGRCLSATHEAAAAVRTEPPCFAMGQAAGTAAAMAALERTTPRAVDSGRLRSRLEQQGAFVGSHV